MQTTHWMTHLRAVARHVGALLALFVLATFFAHLPVDVSLGLVDRPEIVRQLLTDALAQLDAIES
jgi:hypothetical protein